MTEQKIREILTVNDPDKLQRFLRNIKPFKNFPADEKIPIELLEKLVKQYYLKYNVKIQWIEVNFRENGWFGSPGWNYSAEICAHSPWRQLVLIRTKTMYELFAKICIAFFLYTQNGFVGRNGSEGRQYKVSTPSGKSPN